MLLLSNPEGEHPVATSWIRVEKRQRLLLKQKGCVILTAEKEVCGVTVIWSAAIVLQLHEGSVIPTSILSLQGFPQELFLDRITSCDREWRDLRA